MRKRSTLLTTALLLAALAWGSRPAAPVAVPEGNGVPVITDGIFSPGEWDDSLALVLNQSVELRLKHWRGVAFIGVRGRERNLIGPVDLFLAAENGPVHQLHRSAQLGEIVLPGSGQPPPFRYGLTEGWIANEEHRDQELFDQLRGEGKNPIEVIKAATYPTDGVEFAIRRAKLPGRVWRLRLEVSTMIGGQPGLFAYPAGSGAGKTADWLELRFTPE